MKNKGLILILAAVSTVFSTELPARDNDTTFMHFTGSFVREDYFVPAYVPFQMPKNAVKLIVNQSFTTPDGSRGNLDLGLFDEDGYGFNNDKGFRGWSGGARRSFEVSESYATPGYIPGKLDSGEWYVTQMLVSDVDRVDWALDITIVTGKNNESAFVPSYAREKINDVPGWYRFDTHVHTHHSDGKCSPEEVAELAAGEGLDGIFSTDHNTNTSLGHWGNIPDKNFLVINGIEVTYTDGHWNMLDVKPGTWVDFRFRYNEKDRYEAAVRKAKEDGAVVIANHPYNITFMHDKSKVDGIEIWNGPWDVTDQMAVDQWHNLLVAGVYKFATGGSDFHRLSNKIGLPQTVIRCSSLSRGAVIDGLCNGRSYITGSSDITLDFKVTGDGKTAEIGDDIFAKRPVVSFTASAGGVLKMYNVNGTFYHAYIQAGEKVEVTVDNRCGWVRAELYDLENRMQALTNPIFIYPFPEDTTIVTP
ncbi:MAG: CehA/McbA family metallohydrolase [Candidatus Cryptobacteroides sp.]